MLLYKKFTALILAVLITFPAHAEITYESIADQAILDKAEKYLNSMTTLKAHFVQVSSTGETSEGDLYIQRPGKLRLEYAPPTPVLIVSNGHTMVYYDSKLKQVSNVKLDSTPAYILVQENMSFSDEKLSITNVFRQSGAVEISLTYAKEENIGEITLVFSEEPFVLRQWKVRDIQGITTSVGLFEIKTDMKFDPKLFKFKDPRREELRLRK